MDQPKRQSPAPLGWRLTDGPGLERDQPTIDRLRLLPLEELISMEINRLRDRGSPHMTRYQVTMAVARVRSGDLNPPERNDLAEEVVSCLRSMAHRGLVVPARVRFRGRRFLRWYFPEVGP